MKAQLSNWTVKQDDFMIDVEIGHGLTLEFTRGTDGTIAFHGFGLDGHHGVAFPSDYVIDGQKMPDCDVIEWLRGELAQVTAR